MPYDREREDNLLRLEHAVALQLADADDARSALQTVIRALCETQGWEYGRYWQADDAAGVLRFATAWHAADSVIAEHLAASEHITFTPGAGLVGRVWQTGQPLWVSDLTRQQHVLKAQLAPGLALQGACMFPVASQGRVIGVMSFVSRQVREPTSACSMPSASSAARSASSCTASGARRRSRGSMPNWQRACASARRSWRRPTRS